MKKILFIMFLLLIACGHETKNPAESPETNILKALFHAIYMNHYEERLEGFKLAPSFGNVVHIGDSNTEHCEQYLAFGGDNVNRGIGGSTVKDLERLANDILISEQARRYEIRVGTNDLCVGDPLLSNMNSLIDVFTRSVPQADIIIYSILPVDPAMECPGRNNDIIRATNEELRLLANERENVSFRDVYGLFVSDSGALNMELSYDGLHFDEKGCKLYFRAL